MINTITISGNLAQDPEVRLGKNLNESYVTFSLCIHFYNGEEYTQFWRLWQKFMIARRI